MNVRRSPRTLKSICVAALLLAPVFGLTRPADAHVVACKASVGSPYDSSRPVWGEGAAAIGVVNCDPGPPDWQQTYIGLCVKLGNTPSVSCAAGGAYLNYTEIVGTEGTSTTNRKSHSHQQFAPCAEATAGDKKWVSYIEHAGFHHTADSIIRPSSPALVECPDSVPDPDPTGPGSLYDKFLGDLYAEVQRILDP
jgi:hypothetical protein